MADASPVHSRAHASIFVAEHRCSLETKFNGRPDDRLRTAIAVPALATPPMESNSGNKACSICGVEYPRDAQHFKRVKLCRDGFLSYCKKCLSQKNKAWRKRNTEKNKKTDIRQSVTTKTCSTCKIAKPSADFGIVRSEKDGLHPWCRVCYKAARVSVVQKQRKSDAPTTAPRKPIYKKKRCQRCGLVKPNEEFGDARKVCGSCENAASLIVSGLIGAEPGDAERHRRDELAALMFARWNEVSGMK
jgi:hypothetical protein